MFLYLINNVFLFFFYYLNRRKGLLLVMLCSVGVILYLLPTTGDDYEIYKASYESAYYGDTFPYFLTANNFTPEGFYLFYTSFMRLTTGLSFRGFLALNFVLMYLILFKVYKKIFKEEYVIVFFLLSLITIVPTIYYFSPRSSISFVFATCAMIYYALGHIKKGAVFSLLTIMTHFQFIPIISVILLSMLLYKYVYQRIRKAYSVVLIFLFLVLFVLLKYPTLLFEILRPLSSIPMIESLEGKLHYFTTGRKGFRVTSILSIIVFPTVYIILLKKGSMNKAFSDKITESVKKRFLFLLTMVVYTGALINIFFINIPHIAGRLARFSDFTFMMIGLGVFLMSIKDGKKIIPLILTVILLSALFIYRTLYNFNLNIL